MKLTKLTYAVVLTEGPNNWDGYCPDVPSVFSAGADIHDQRKRLASALAFHLECLAADGEPIPYPRMTTPEEALEHEAKTDAEYAAEFPDEPTDQEEGWSEPIAEMMEIETNITNPNPPPARPGRNARPRRRSRPESPAKAGAPSAHPEPVEGRTP